MADLRIALEELREESESGKPAGIAVCDRKRTRLWSWGAVAIGMLLVTVGLVWYSRNSQPSSELRAVPLTAYSGSEQDPSFSPDGGKVAFSWNGEKEDNYDIYVKQIGAPGTQRLTTNPATESNPSWSPDDKWIAFLRWQKDSAAILVMPSVGGQERKIAESRNVRSLLLRLSWTPDARWLAFVDRDLPQGPSSIVAVNVDTGERRQLTTFVTRSTGAAMGDSSPSISLDGSALAFARQVKSFVFELYVQRLSRDMRPIGAPTRVTDGQYPEICGIAWSADGRDIVYAAGSNQIQNLWRVPVSGRRAPERLAFALPATMTPAISGSPPRLVYVWWQVNVRFWRLDTRTGERTMLMGSTYVQAHPQYSPNGRKIAFQANQSGNVEIWTSDPDGSHWNKVTSFDGPQCGSPTWSPDGSWLALDSDAEGQSEIYVVAADGGQPRRLTDHPAMDFVPSWSHDGDWIYFSSDRTGKFEIWKVRKEGGAAVQVTLAGGRRAFESPDGVYIYYGKSMPLAPLPGLFRMPAQGGEETKILQGGFPFAVTSRGIYFSPDEKTIKLLDSRTGKISLIATLDRPRLGNFCISPDDAYVVWAQAGRESKDLMLVDGFR